MLLAQWENCLKRQNITSLKYLKGFIQVNTSVHPGHHNMLLKDHKVTQQLRQQKKMGLSKDKLACER